MNSNSTASAGGSALLGAKQDVRMAVNHSKQQRSSCCDRAICQDALSGSRGPQRTQSGSGRVLSSSLAYGSTEFCAQSSIYLEGSCLLVCLLGEAAQTPIAIIVTSHPAQTCHHATPSQRERKENKPRNAKKEQKPKAPVPGRANVDPLKSFKARTAGLQPSAQLGMHRQRAGDHLRIDALSTSRKSADRSDTRRDVKRDSLSNSHMAQGTQVPQISENQKTLAGITPLSPRARLKLRGSWSWPEFKDQPLARCAASDLPTFRPPG